jgi:hypothetical protein
MNWATIDYDKLPRTKLPSLTAAAINTPIEDDVDLYRQQLLTQLSSGQLKCTINTNTFIENHLSDLQKHALAQLTENPNSRSLSTKLDQDLKRMLKSTNNDIKLAMYNISRCVNAGDFH